MEIPNELRDRIAGFADLTRWERREVGRALRALGLSYGEIRRFIDVPKGTLAGWCRDIELTDEQCQAIVERTGSRKGVPNDTQRKRRLEIESIEQAARRQAASLSAEPLWVAGTVLYWAEGSKTSRRVELANSDPAALRLFIEWCHCYHDPRGEFRLALHLHHGNDEATAKRFWRHALALPTAGFTKTYIKPPGTGHRKNSLEHGVCRALLRRSTDAFFRTMAWIEVLASELAPASPIRPTAILPGGPLAQLARATDS